MRRFGKNPGRTCVFALLGACVFGMAGVAHAGGFEIPDNGARALGRGGANTVAVKDLTALQYNPGAIARLKGSRIMWHHNLVWHESSFQRAPLGDGWGPKAGTTFEKAENSEGFFGLGGFVGLSLDLGDFSEKARDFSIALGIYGPSAVGKSDYRKTITDPSTGKKVKDNYGPQSFMLNNTDLILVYYSLAFAWEVPNKFGIGLTLQAADLQRMKYGLVVDSTAVTGLGSLTPVPNGASGQLQTELNLKDHFAPTAILGMWWRPIRNLELGFSTRFIPIHLEPEGGVKVDKPSLISDELHAKLELNLPPIVRAGLRYVHMDGEREVFDIEADVVWEGWSSIDEYRINMTGEIAGQSVEEIVIEKAWKDTVSVRVGGDWNVVPRHLTIRAGGFWESAASPLNYSHLDFPSFQRFGIGAGLTWDISRRVSLTASYMHVFQETRDVSEDFAKQYQERPLRPCPGDCGGSEGVPANAGRFESKFDTLALGLDIEFGQFFRKGDE
ncbi:MAG: outer membrane protein transport protein [Myxococcota bacterium]